MKIKVCGMREKNNLMELVSLEPDYVGFIFYNKSKRYVSEVPFDILPKTIQRVGVFVNAQIDEIKEKIENYKLDIIQLHGDETPESCKKLRAGLNDNHSNVKLMKAFAVDAAFEFDDCARYEQVCDYFLFDTKGQYYGGNSKTFDWELLQNYHGNLPYFLSGGIGSESVDNLKAFFKSSQASKCKAIDVNSKFEDSPGIKNIERIKNFKVQLL